MGTFVDREVIFLDVRHTHTVYLYHDLITLIPFQSVVHDLRSTWQQDSFVCPVSGVYQINSSVGAFIDDVENIFGRLDVFLYQNGVEIVRNSVRTGPVPFGYLSQTCSGISITRHLIEGNSYSIHARAVLDGGKYVLTAANNLLGSSSTYLQIARIPSGYRMGLN